MDYGRFVWNGKKAAGTDIVFCHAVDGALFFLKQRRMDHYYCELSVDSDPGSCGLAALEALAEGGKCPPAEYIVCPLCVLYGANMEQMGAVLLGLIW